MFWGDNPSVPMIDQPVPVFVELVSLLLEDVEEKFCSQKRVACHDQDKCNDEQINKSVVPVQSSKGVVK